MRRFISLPPLPPHYHLAAHLLSPRYPPPPPHYPPLPPLLSTTYFLLSPSLPRPPPHYPSPSFPLSVLRRIELERNVSLVGYACPLLHPPHHTQVIVVATATITTTTLLLLPTTTTTTTTADLVNYPLTSDTLYLSTAPSYSQPLRYYRYYHYYYYYYRYYYYHY